MHVLIVVIYAYTAPSLLKKPLAIKAYSHVMKAKKIMDDDDEEGKRERSPAIPVIISYRIVSYHIVSFIHGYLGLWW